MSYLKNIQRFLTKKPYGASVSEIARELLLTRATIAKYCQEGFFRGVFGKRQEGQSVVWCALKKNMMLYYIIECPKCGVKSLSHQAASCPACGYDTQKPKKKEGKKREKKD